MKDTKARILVADDEDSLRWVLEKGLRQAGYEVLAVKDGTAALQAFAAEPFDVVFLDVRMPGVDGLTALARLREMRADACVIVMTAHGTMDTAIQAMQRGAYDYLAKPFDIDEVLLLIERALTARGWDVFWDEELRLGDRFRQALAAELTSARCVVVLWSTLSVQSEWVLDEASRANKRGKLIAVQIDDVELPLGFGEMQVGNLIGWDGDPEALGFRELVQGVSDKLARAIKPAASVVAAP